MFLEKRILRLTDLEKSCKLKLYCNGGKGEGKRGRRQRESTEESEDKKLAVS